MYGGIWQMQATAHVWRMEKKLVFLVLSFIWVPLTKSRLSGLVASAFTTDLTEPGADSFPQLLPSLLTGYIRWSYAFTH